MNGLNNYDETHREYSVAATDDLIRFWRWKVKGQGHSKSSSWRRHSRRRWGVEIHLLVYVIFQFHLAQFPHRSCYTRQILGVRYSIFASRIFVGSKEPIMEILCGAKTVLTRSAITPPKVNRYEWNLENCEHIVGGWLWQIVGAIRAVATVWEAAEILLFGQVNNARFHRFPVGHILRHLNNNVYRWGSENFRNRILKILP